MNISAEYMQVMCKQSKCPVRKNCAFLPTEMHPSPEGKIDILFVGQGGGENERKYGRPFVGKAGLLLRKMVVLLRQRLKKHIGVAFSNTIRDCPEGLRLPNDKELGNCMQYLYRDIETLKKRGLRAIVPVGYAAKKDVTGEMTGSITATRGRTYKMFREGITDTFVVPTYHPSFLARNGCKAESLAKLLKYEKIVLEDMVKAYELGEDMKDVEIATETKSEQELLQSEGR